MEIKIKADKENPRNIAPESLDKLKESISDFGDLAGLVCNKRTGEWVCGHQRNKALNKLFPGHKIIQGKEVMVNGDKEWEGEVVTKDGKKTGFKVRIVDKDVEWQKMANIIANDQRIQGTYDIEKLETVLKKYDSPMIEKYDLPTLKIYADDIAKEQPEKEHEGSDKGWTHTITIKCTAQSYEVAHKAITQSTEITEMLKDEKIEIYF